MKGCEIQCGNRFHYLLIWPCCTVFSSKQRTVGCHVRVYAFNTLEGLRAGSLALSHLNSCKFHRRYGWNTLKLFGVYVKDLKFGENQDATWTCCCGVGLKRKPTARWAKLLTGRKGQKLVFHFLNNRHNHSTVTLVWILSFRKEDGWKRGQVTGSQCSSDSVCTSLYSLQSVSAALS